MQWRVTTPSDQMGSRYAFQFQGASDADWKQRRKESSTIADAASVKRLLMSSRSALQCHGALEIHSSQTRGASKRRCSVHIMHVI